MERSESGGSGHGARIVHVPLSSSRRARCSRPCMAVIWSGVSPAGVDTARGSAPRPSSSFTQSQPCVVAAARCSGVCGRVRERHGRQGSRMAERARAWERVWERGGSRQGAIETGTGGGRGEGKMSTRKHKSKESIFENTYKIDKSTTLPDNHSRPPPQQPARLSRAITSHVPLIPPP